MTATAAPVSLDLVLGERGATRCGLCDKHLPATATRFELEDTRTGQPLCDLCANRQHHGLRLAVALLNAVLDAHAAGNRQQAEETLRGIVNGVEMIEETATPVPYRRPARHQPVRSRRRDRRR